MAEAEIILRGHRPGDMGLVISRQAVLYATEFGWNIEFEALLAEVSAAFIRNFDREREAAFIAERDGIMLGSAFVVRASDELAKLRMLYVEPSAQGLGLGRRLVRSCVGFARSRGYSRMTLWTNDVLHAARRIYESEGFRLVATEAHHSFGVDLVGETWDLDLAKAEPS